MTARRRIAHVITGLEVGGAETALFRLLERIDRERFDCRVYSLKGDGPLGERIRGAGVEVDALSIDSNPLGALGLARRLHRFAPDVVQTWLYHADLIGGMAARIAGIPALIWSVRHANLEAGSNERSVLILARALAALSSWMPRCILFNSEAARDSHAAIGYANDPARVIPNGFDTSTFVPDGGAREALLREYSAPDSTRWVGLVARFHPQKDHATFLRAAAAIRRRVPETRFLLCGRDVTGDNAALTAGIEAEGLADSVHLLGVRDDLPRVQAGLDVAVSSSVGEAFPNAIGEAMACGVPCVVTDVGDSALLVGDTGRVVPRRDPDALASACVDLLSGLPEELRRMGAAARRRVEKTFSLSAMVGRYEELYAAVATNDRRALRRRVG